jgi:hypothetical protein
MSDSDITRELIRQIEEMKNTVKRLEVNRALFEAVNIDSFIRSIGANIDDYNVGNYDYVLLNTTAPRNISGIAGGILGRRIVIQNYGSTLTFLHESALSVATNRIYSMVGTNKAIASGESAMLLYVDNLQFTGGYRWRLLFPAN